MAYNTLLVNVEEEEKVMEQQDNNVLIGTKYIWSVRVQPLHWPLLPIHDDDDDDDVIESGTKKKYKRQKFSAGVECGWK